jgi:hypothetical protein
VWFKTQVQYFPVARRIMAINQIEKCAKLFIWQGGVSQVTMLPGSQEIGLAKRGKYMATINYTIVF